MNKVHRQINKIFKKTCQGCHANKHFDCFTNKKSYNPTLLQVFFAPKKYKYSRCEKCRIKHNTRNRERYQKLRLVKHYVQFNDLIQNLSQKGFVIY